MEIACDDCMKLNGKRKIKNKRRHAQTNPTKREQIKWEKKAEEKEGKKKRRRHRLQ